MKEVVVLPKDPNSYSQPEYVVITHFHLDWLVNFDEKKLSGSVLLHLDIKEKTIKQLVLDSKELSISQVLCESTGQKLDFELGPPHSSFGSKLSITLPQDECIKESLSLCISYSTSPSCSGLQWLTPQLTSGKAHPFLFSQCQAIHARALFPCQDTPQVKATYSASVECPAPLVVLMSALQEEVPTQLEGAMTHKYSFRQPVSIPSYLLALVVGAVESRRISPRSRVWAEPKVLDAAAFEFAETESMLQAAESICGDYIWGQYDLLVLPPSFPYGGMENPCITFVTPTLLAGDRSLADVIAHEICHSWTGNLVTNCNWEHFWLNEGFTVFLERKVKERLHGAPERHLSAIEGWSQLQYCVDTRGSDDPLTCLVPSMDGVDPDDAFSSVPYEKGHALLWHLETLLGGAGVFDLFLRAYLARFKGQALDTAAFVAFLGEYFEGRPGAACTHLATLDWHAWLRTPGMPPCKPQFDTSLADACDSLARAWTSWDGSSEGPFGPLDLEAFSSRQVLVWLSGLLDAGGLPLAKVERMASVYPQLDESQNAEVKFRWLRLCLRARWPDKVGAAFDFVNTQCRMKFVRPIYRDLYDWKEVREKAIANFLAQKHNMMHVCAHTIAKDLHMDCEAEEGISATGISSNS